jgi:chromosome partitioning protein
MARIFCIANQKGGVGKTTSTVNLAAGLGRIGQRVLVVDLDPQGNATMGSGIDKRKLPLTVYDVLLETATIAEARTRNPDVGYDVVGANRELAGAEIELVELERRDKRLKRALQAVESEYDFVLIDCPPSLSMLTLNGLCCAHGVMVPMQCEYFALEGLSDLVNTIKQVHANLNPELQVIGLLRVMFDPRITLQQQVSDQLKAHFGEKVFDTVIPRNVRLAEAPSYGLPGVVFDPASRGAQAFMQFAKEMVQRVTSNPLFMPRPVATVAAPTTTAAPAKVEVEAAAATKPADVEAPAPAAAAATGRTAKKRTSSSKRKASSQQAST